MNIECQCKFLRNCTINKFIESYRSDSKPNLCEKHKNKYSFYCKDCKKDLCDDCLKEKATDNNTTGNITKHKMHSLINLSFDLDKFKEDNNIYFDKDHDSSKDNLKIILNNILKNYFESPSYRGLKAIKSINEFLKNPYNKKSNLIFKELKKIKSIKQLEENINTPDLIYKIEIDGEKEDISFQLYLVAIFLT